MARRVLLLSLCLLPLVAHAQAPASPPGPSSPGKLEPERDKLRLLTDGKSHYVAVRPFTSEDHTLFYGDGKRFFSVPMQSRSSQGDTAFLITFVDPRYFIEFRYAADVQLRDGKYTVSCGSHTVPMTLVDAATAKPLLDKATFEPSPRQWSAYALGRDQTGTYYYVDHGRTPETTKRFRLFIGPKGNMKQQKMTNVVSDSEGDIFATKTGSMRLILDKKESSWTALKKTTPLRIIPVEDNLGMIYNELGVYEGERLGTPCDDL